jgi:hypothetical protein
MYWRVLWMSSEEAAQYPSPTILLIIFGIIMMAFALVMLGLALFIHFYPMSAAINGTHAMMEPPAQAVTTPAYDNFTYAPYEVEMTILTPDKGYTCDQYYNWVLGVNSYDDKNGVAFDPNMPAAFPISGVPNATIVGIPDARMLPVIDQTTDDKGSTIMTIVQGTTYHFSISGKNVAAHSFKLVPEDYLYHVCLENTTAMMVAQP